MRGKIRFAVLSFVCAILSLVIPYRTAAVESTPADTVQQTGGSPTLRPASQRCINPEQVFLPMGDLFNPLIADPKEPRFYVSYRMFKFGSSQIHAATTGYGEFFGLYRHNASAGGYSWQADLGGAIHAQFDLHAPSLDLVNADYVIGFPVSFRKDNTSYRIALFHQSSHLGDEFLLHNNVQRIELSFEALELLKSHEWREWRLYYGGDYIVHQGPTNIRPGTIQAGMEYYGQGSGAISKGRLVAGWDLKFDQEHDWSMNSSVKAGLQFDSSSGDGRYIRVLAEGYKGFTPYGQFYMDRITYLGIGLYLGFE